MVTIGDTTLPGVEANVTSALSIGVSVTSPGEVGLIGEADLSEGTANANEVYRVTTANKAEVWFGQDSPLAQICSDALREGAFPVYAVAVEEVTGTETVPSGPAVDSFDNAPVSEVADTYDVSAIDTDAYINKHYGDVSNVSSETLKVDVNPIDGAYQVGDAASGTEDISYSYFNYEAAVDELVKERGDSVDFIAPWTENRSVVDYVETSVDGMEDHYEFAICLAGATGTIQDTSTYDNPYDNSRVQLIYPGRNEAGESIIGSYAGLRSALGISKSPMRKRFSGQRNLYHRLNTADYEALVAENVNPISSRSAGARILEDQTTAQDDNLDENAFQQGISRLICDYVTLIVQQNADAFIGELHTVSARNTLRSVIETELSDLRDQDTLIDYTVSVAKIDSLTAEVNVGIETVKPLRNIVANVTAGQVN